MKPFIVKAGAVAAFGVAAIALAWSAQAQFPLERQMAQAAPPPAKANPFAGNSAAAAEGRNFYNQTCTSCHGVDGAAGEFAPGLAISGRIYAQRSDEQIFNAIKNGIPGTAMPGHAQALADDQIWKITAFIYGLRGTAIDVPTDGDVAAGKVVFEGKGQCLSCHMVSGKGSVIGPDLTNIASQKKVDTIIASLTKANNRVLPPGGYQSYRLTPLETYPVVNIVTNDGRKIRGVVRNEDSYSIQVMSLDENLYSFQRNRLQSVTYETGRLMPYDYDKRLTQKEFADLLAYVTRLGTPRSVAAAPRPAGGPSE
jgi:putative heme-binding domain-containing protein